MRNKSIKLRLAYFLRPRLRRRDSSDALSGFVSPASGWERTESVIEDILRWADDGGQMLDIDNLPYPSNISNTPEQSDNHGS
jgi:hypothetical protein